MYDIMYNENGSLEIQTGQMSETGKRRKGFVMYPVNEERNSTLYASYKALTDKEDKVIFGGRLGEYKYYDMDQVIAAALAKAEELLPV